MTTPSPFDHRPDPELGTALREVLAGADDARFARRVLAAAGTQLGPAAGWVDVLTRWARPGLAAALALVAGVTFWLTTQSPPANGAALADPLRVSDEGLAVPALFASTSDPDVDVVLAVALGN